MNHPWILSHFHDHVFEMAMPPRSSDEEIDEFCRAHVAWARAHMHPHAHMFDMRHATTLTAKQRRRYSQHVEDMHAAGDTYWNVGVAYVAESPLVRGAITAVFWIAPPPFPYKVVSTPEEGRRWVEQQLSRGRLR